MMHTLSIGHAGLPVGHKNSFATMTMGIQRRVVVPQALYQIQRLVAHIKPTNTYR